MKRETTRTVALILLGAFCGVSHSQLNPITNGSFEQLTPEGIPVDWEYVGEKVEVSNDAHSGERSLRLVRAPGTKAAETGLNRRWKVDSGEQGAMLAELKGGFRFWYKAVSCTKGKLVVFAIPMSSKPLEDTGTTRAAFEVPADHVGDGQWHEGVLRYDFTMEPKAKWVHVSPRLLCEAGELLLDDFTYVEKVGPLLSVPRLNVVESDTKPGQEATVTATVANTGDEALENVRVVLRGPKELTVTGPETIIPRLVPDESRRVTWTLTGERQSDTVLRVHALSGDLLASGTATLKPDVCVASFLADPFLLAPDGVTTVNLRLENRGLAGATGVRVQLLPMGSLSVLDQKDRALPALAPGGLADIAWKVKAQAHDGKNALIASVQAADKSIYCAARGLQVTTTVKAPAKQFAGPLWYRTDASGTVGEVRIGSADADVVAMLPHLGRVLLPNSKGETEEVRARVDSTQRKTGGTIEAVSKVRDSEGGEWTFTVSATQVDVTRVKVRVRATCNQNRWALAFEGPVVCWLEDQSARRDEAMLGGLEWLVDDEVSSGTLDIAEDHSDRIRYVPHPNKITIPFASVHNQRGAFGLLWDVHQKWDGVNDRPQPVFASPDRFEGRRCHLMGLMAPNVLNGLKENERLAETPIQLPASKALTLEATLYADPKGRDALSAMDAWFLTYRPDPVLPPPKGDYVGQTEFSMRAYLESLYIPEEKAWWPYLGGPALWRKQHHSPAYAYDLLMATRITKDPGLAAKYRALADEQLGAGRPKGPGAKPVADDLGFDAGGAESQLLGLSATARSLADSMGQDGSWRFDADLEDHGVFKGLDYHELGKDNAAELGTCANKAYQILRYARMSGDVELYRAGVKALEFMKQFRVPRAAQVWEVPVHTPDILAAADAVDAYLEAYRFSGDPQWLGEAKRWARAGLPFVYVWNDPRYPWMRYGSIPVMGATWFRGSWFGVLVQWNGLRHAYALLKLSEYDSSSDRGYTWKDFAAGLTHSAMYQQSDEAKNVALWPDSYNTMNAGRANWDFAPRQILQNVYMLIGRQSEPETVALGHGETKRQREAPTPLTDLTKATSRLYLSSSADILSAGWRGGRFEAFLRYPSQEQGHSLVVGVKRPSKVMLDGKELPESKNLDEQTAAGWRFDGRYNCLIIKVAHDGEAKLVVEGVASEWKPCAPRTVKEINFTFDRDPDGWVEANDLAPFENKDGVLITRATGGDPYMVRTACRVSGDAVRTIVVRMRVSGGEVGQFYWTTEASPAFAEDKVVVFKLSSDGQFHDYRIAVGDHALWRGQTITGIRLDPGNGAEGAEVGVDLVRGE